MRNKLLVFLLVFVVSGVAWVVYTGIEFYDKTIDLGWTTEAHRNPYLAAEKFLQTFGLKTTISSQLKELDSLDDVDFLFIENIDHVVSRKQTEQIMSWVESGGYLVAGVDAESDRKNLLLEKLSVSVDETDYQCDCGDEGVEKMLDTLSDMNDENSTDNKKKKKSLSDFLRKQNKRIREDAEKSEIEKTSNINEGVSEKQRLDRAINKKEITRVHFKGNDRELELHFNPYTALSHPVFNQASDEEVGSEDDSQVSVVESGVGEKPDHVAYNYEPSSWGGSDAGIHFMQFEIGDGFMMFLSDSSVWNSYNINKLDHAYFLREAAPDEGSVLILYGAFMPSLFMLIFEKFPEFCVLLLLAVICFLLYKSRRFGVIIAPQTTVRRSLAEHLSMRARYAWRAGHYNDLIKPLQQDIESALRLKHPSVSAMNIQQKNVFLSAMSKLSSQRVSVLMTMVAINDTQDFTNAIIDLQHIRNTL